MPQLDPQHRGRYFVEPAIPTLLLADVFPGLPVVTEQPQARRDLFRIGDDHPGVAVGAEVLAGIEAEAAQFTERPGLAAAVAGADGLRVVFDHLEAAARRHLEDGVHCGGQAVEMDRDDGTGFRRNLRFEQRRVEVERAGLDVREHRARTQHADDPRSRNERKRGDNHFVAAADPANAQRQQQRIGARGDADTEPPAAVARQFLLERRPVRAQDELLRADYVVNRGADFVRDGGGLRPQVNQRDGLNSFAGRWVHGGINQGSRRGVGLASGAPRRPGKTKGADEPAPCPRSEETDYFASFFFKSRQITMAPLGSTALLPSSTCWMMPCLSTTNVVRFAN